MLLAGAPNAISSDAQPASSLGAGWTDATVATLYSGGRLGGPSVTKDSGNETVAVVVASEDLSLALDLWVFSALSASRESPIAHGVVVDNGAGWLVHRLWSMDSVVALAAATPPIAVANEAGTPVAGAAPSGFSTIVPSAISLTPSLVTVTLRGVPHAAALAAFTGGAATPANDHVVVIRATNTSILIPAGSLRSGWVYTASATASLSAAWSFSPTQKVAAWGPSWGVPAGLGSIDTTRGLTYNAFDAVPSLPATSAFAPRFYAHLPLIGGSLTAVTTKGGLTTGVALDDTFAVQVGAWQAPDNVALASVADTTWDDVAAAYVAMMPLPDAIPSALLRSGGVVTTTAACFASGAAASPAWLRAWNALAAPLRLSGMSACVSALTLASTARVALPTRTYYFQLFAGSAAPNAATAFGISTLQPRGLVAPSDALALQSMAATLRSTPPGFALAPPQIAPFITSFLLLPSGIKSAAELSSESTVETVVSIIIDEYGCAGVAFASVLLTPTLSAAALDSPSAVGAVAATATAALSSTLGNASSSNPNPLATITIAGSIAQLIGIANGLSAAGVGTASTASANAAVATTLAGIVATSLDDLGATTPANVARTVDDSTLVAASSTVSVVSSAAFSGPQGSSNVVSTVTAASLAAASASLLRAAASSSDLLLPPAAGASFLSAISNLAGSGLGASAAAANASVAVSSALSALTSAALRSAKPGDAPLTITTTVAPSTRADGLLVYCGSGLSLSAARVTLGDSGAGAFLLAVSAPLPPCVAAGSAVSMPPTVVSSAPAPSVQLSASSLASLSAALGPRAVDVRVVQWGVSPHNETAGLSEIEYPAPRRTGAQTVIVRSAARRLVDGWVAPTAAGSAGVSGLSVVDAAMSAVNALAPPPVTVKDALPTHPIDTRVVSIALADSATGMTINTTLLRAGVVFNVTLPLRDPSLTEWNATTGAASSVKIAQAALLAPVFALTCPSGPLPAGAAVPARVSGARTGEQPLVRFISSQSLAFGAALSAAPQSASTSAATTLDATGSGGSSVSANIAAQGFAALLAADCGAGGQSANTTFLCTGGMNVSFACPQVAPTATCLSFNNLGGAWGNGVCKVSSTSATSISCACTATGDIAGRFAGLRAQGANVFAPAGATFLAPTPFLWGDMQLISVAAALVAAIALAAIAGAVADATSARAYSKHVSVDRELVFFKVALGMSESFIDDASVVMKTTPAKKKAVKRAAVAPELSPSASTVAVREAFALPAPPLLSTSDSPELAALWVRLCCLLEPLAMVPPSAAARVLATAADTGRSFQKGAFAAAPRASSNRGAFDAAFRSWLERKHSAALVAAATASATTEHVAKTGTSDSHEVSARFRTDDMQRALLDETIADMSHANATERVDGHMGDDEGASGSDDDDPALDAAHTSAHVHSTPVVPRRVLLAVACRRAVQLHPLLALRYFLPSQTRAARAGLVGAGAIVPLATAAYAYANLSFFNSPLTGMPGEFALAPLPAGLIMMLAALTAGASTLILVVLSAVLRWGGAAEEAARWPLLAGERRRRAAFAIFAASRGGNHWIAAHLRKSAPPDGRKHVHALDADSSHDTRDAGKTEKQFARVVLGIGADANRPRGCSTDIFALIAARRIAPIPASVGMSTSTSARGAHAPRSRAGVGCTCAFGVSFVLTWAVILFCFSYVSLFGLLRGGPASVSVLFAWIASVALLFALRSAGEIVWLFVRFRFVGRSCGLPIGAVDVAPRLSLLTSVRATAAVNGLPLDVALILSAAPSAVIQALSFSPEPGSRAAGRAAISRRVYLMLLLGATPAAVRAAAAGDDDDDDVIGTPARTASQNRALTPASPAAHLRASGSAAKERADDSDSRSSASDSESDADSPQKLQQKPFARLLPRNNLPKFHPASFRSPSPSLSVRSAGSSVVEPSAQSPPPALVPRAGLNIAAVGAGAAQMRANSLGTAGRAALGGKALPALRPTLARAPKDVALRLAPRRDDAR